MRNKKKIVALLTGGMMIAGVAYAAWTASGTGSGFSKASSAQDLTTNDLLSDATSGLARATALTATSNEADMLWPGNTGDVKITIVNPNPYPIQVDTITKSGDIVTMSGDTVCDGAHAVTYTTQPGPFDVAADSQTAFTLTNAVHMGNASDTTCQGEVFKIPVTLTGVSDATS